MSGQHGFHIRRPHPCPPCLTLEKTQRALATTESSGNPELMHQEVRPGSLPVASAHLGLPTLVLLKQSWAQPSPSASLRSSTLAVQAPGLVGAEQSHHCEARSLRKPGKEV